jgi:hypothetical protein
MSSSTGNLKTIKVNPIFLSSANSSGQVKNKTRKEKPSLSASLGQTNNVQKKLIARIKDFQQTGNKNNKNSNNKSSIINSGNTTEDEFNESLKFLDDLAQDKNERKNMKHNTTLKKKQPIDKQAYMQIATELPPELNWDTFKIPASPAQHRPLVQPIIMQPPAAMPMSVPVPAMPMPAPITAPITTPLVNWQPPPAPSYGNLKNGNKPTFRNWQRTTQKIKHQQPTINILDDIVLDKLDLTEKDDAKTDVHVIQSASIEPAGPVPATLVPATLVPATLVPATLVPAPTISYAPTVAYAPAPIKPRRKRVTRTLKYKLGKHKNGKISVLIKNAHTRRKVQTETALLKQKSILDIKNYLRGNNLLKVGSEAPNDVLRQMYEQSILAGQIENKAGDVLMHNYFNNDK